MAATASAAPSADVDPAMAKVAAEYRVGSCTPTPGASCPASTRTGSATGTSSDDVVVELTTKAERMVALGVPADGILIDPTHDFGKNTWHSLELMRHCDRFVETRWPILMALSHKNFISETLVWTSRAVSRGPSLRPRSPRGTVLGCSVRTACPRPDVPATWWRRSCLLYTSPSPRDS